MYKHHVSTLSNFLFQKRIDLQWLAKPTCTWAMHWHWMC